MAEAPDNFVHGAGMTVQYSTNGSSWVSLDNLISVDTPQKQRGRIAASTLETPYKVSRRRPGWINPGENKFQLALTKDVLNALLAHYFAGTNLYWREIYPSDLSGDAVGYVAYRGWIGDMQEGAGIQRDQDELVMIDMTVVVESLVPNDYYVGTAP